jgi:hypothetical protein
MSVAFVRRHKMQHNYVLWESVKCFSNIVWRPFMVSRMTADYCVVSNVSCVLLSGVMQYFALFCAEASRGFKKFRVLRRRGDVTCVISG